MLPSTVDLKVETNICYAKAAGVKQEPEYAEVESVIKMKSNEAYASTRNVQVTSA